jgi:hypothetical protein
MAQADNIMYQYWTFHLLADKLNILSKLRVLPSESPGPAEN